MSSPSATGSTILGLFKIRPGEAPKVSAMAAYLFCAVGAFIVGRISRDTLFLELRDARSLLPYMYIGIAGGVSLSVYVYTRLERRFRRDRLTGVALGVFAASVAAHRALLATGTWVYWTYYVWVDVIGTIMIIQCWNFAGDIFNAREAKRLFAVIGGGGVLANVVWGFAVKQCAGAVGTPNLLLVMAALIAGALALQQWLRRFEPPRRVEPAHEGAGAIRAQAASAQVARRQLRLMAAVVAATFFVSTLVDYQFKIITGTFITASDARAAFFGSFFGLTGLLSAVIQFGFTGRLLERFGVLVALLLLPLTMLAGTSALIAAPGLWAATFTKGAENVLRYTVNDATMQLLYVPVPAAVRGRAKSTIDGMLKPLAIGASGLFLLAAAPRLGVYALAWFASAALLVWALLLFALKREYVKTLMLTLRTRRLDFSGAALEIADDSTVAVLGDALASGNEGQILHALELLHYARAPSEALKARVLALLESASLPVRLAALKYLGQRAGADDVPAIAAFLDDPSPEVRAHAASAVASLGRERALVALQGRLKDDAPRVKAAAVAGLIQYGGLDGILRSAEELKAMLGHADPRVREQGAWVLGEIRVKTFYQPVLTLFDDPDPAVRVAAVQAAGKMQSPELVPALIYLLENSRTAAAAALALAGFGASVEPLLLKVLHNPREALAVRAQVPKIFARIASRSGYEALLALIAAPEPALRSQIIWAACRLQEHFADVALDEARVEAVVREELSAFYRIVVMRADLVTSGDDVLLDDALRGLERGALQRIFRLLGLLHTPKTLDIVYSNLSANLAAARANAVEILDNILKNEHKRLVIPIAEDLPVAERLRIAREAFSLERRPAAAWLRELMSGDGGWLVAVGIHAAGQRRIAELTADVQAHLASDDALVKETAVWALSRLLAPARFAEAAAPLAADGTPRVRELARALLAREGA